MGNNYSNGIAIAFTHGQRTNRETPAWSGSDYVASIVQRKAMAARILDNSKALQSDPTSSNWIYLGLGGFGHSTDDSNDTSPDGCTTSDIVNTFNPWIYERVASMAVDKIYYPFGIVLMDQITSTATAPGTSHNVGPDVLKQVLRLNQRYRMKSNPDYDAGVNPGFPSVAPGFDSGFEDGGDAI